MSYLELFWSVFSHIPAEYGEIPRISPYPVREIQTISPYSVRIRENTDQNNSEYVHFLRSVSRKLKALMLILHDLRLEQDASFAKRYFFREYRSLTKRTAKTVGVSEKHR